MNNIGTIMKLSELKSRISHYDENKGIFRRIFGDSRFITLLKQFILDQDNSPDTSDIRFDSFINYLKELSITLNFDLLHSGTLSSDFIRDWYFEIPVLDISIAPIDLQLTNPVIEGFEYKSYLQPLLILNTDIPAFPTSALSELSIQPPPCLFENLCNSLIHERNNNFGHQYFNIPPMGNFNNPPMRNQPAAPASNSDDRVVIFGEDRAGLGEIFREVKSNSGYHPYFQDDKVSDAKFDSGIISISDDLSIIGESKSPDTKPIDKPISLRNDPLNNTMWVLILTFLELKMLLRVRSSSHLFHNLPLRVKDEKHYFFKCRDYHHQKFLQTLPAPTVITHQQVNLLNENDDYNIEADGSGFIMRG
jgi:hypothetical protein